MNFFKKLFSKALQENDNKLTGLEAMNTERITFQALETLDILNNTKNKETFFSRLDFLETLYPDILKNSQKSNYMDYAIAPIKFFKDSYGEENLTDAMKLFLVNTNDCDFDAYRIELIYAFMVTSLQNQVNSANQLKMQSAKIKRKEKILEDIREFKQEAINRCYKYPNINDFLGACDEYSAQVIKFE